MSPENLSVECIFAYCKIEKKKKVFLRNYVFLGRNNHNCVLRQYHLWQLGSHDTPGKR